MEAVVYLLLGLAVVGALVYALMQVNTRQQRLHTELTRLERLTAEVTMNAEAVLEQVDQRIERLNQLAAAIEAKARATLVEAAPPREEEPAPKPAAAAKKGGTSGRSRSRSQAKKAPKPAEVLVAEATPAAAQAAAVQAPQPQAPEPPPAPKSTADRYSDLRQAVSALADQGKSPLEIAEALSVPRGEVQLMLNLRGRKVSPS